MSRLALLTLVLAPGCGLWHNSRRFLHPAEHVIDGPLPEGELAAVSYASGWMEDPPRPYDPLPAEHGLRPVDLSPGGWVRLDPVDDDAELSIWIRRTGIVQQGFAPVVTVTGAVKHSLPLQVRTVAGPLDAPRTLAIEDLTNVYNDYRFEDGDLLLLQVADRDGTVERYWFRHREVGLRTKAVAGVLVRVPIPWEATADFSPSPALAAGLALGWRPRTRRPRVRWLFDQVAVLGSVGIGSTALDTVVGGEVLEDQVSGAFNAALAGGGVEVFDFLSLQVLANVTSAFREANETPATLAVGVDAIRFAAFARDATQRLLYPNELQEPPVE